MLFGLIMAGYGWAFRFVTRDRAELSDYAATGLTLARLLIPVGLILAGMGALACVLLLLIE